MSGRWKSYWRKRWFRWLNYNLGVLLLLMILIPSPRFNTPNSTVIYSADSVLLYAQVAEDEQWRFPETGQELPEKYKRALIEFEDRHFYQHPGVNPVSLLRSARQDLRARRIVSGGSTITMQLARISRNNPPRTFLDKGLEILMALKAEVLYSKKTILRKYAAHAPFGSNVVGIEAACWRFFGIEPGQISWAQAATLAVLPNHPALIFPGKNQERLMAKRNKLLERLFDKGFLDHTSYQLALQEPVPGAPKPLPQRAEQLALRYQKAGMKQEVIYSTVRADLQLQGEEIIRRHYQYFKANHIHNAALMIVDLHSGQVLSYVGNTQDTASDEGHSVDMIVANRSYGSLLKPILFMTSMEESKLTPHGLLPDYPMAFGNFHPKNYNLEYDGLVAADRALIRSLNIPNVALLQRLGTANFLNALRNLGFTTFDKAPEYYGLTLILGGAESSLWQLTGAYASLAANLKGEGPHFELSLLPTSKRSRRKALTQEFNSSRYSPNSIWTAFQIMTELYRPGDNGHWEQFTSSQKIAWKTGTSFGGRDAWAIGVNARYAIGVWVGNASGEGRPDLVGAQYAAPVMFDAFESMPQAPWFKKPEKGWVKTKICPISGYPANPDCPNPMIRALPKMAAKTDHCPYHKLINLDSSRSYQVNSSCVNPLDMVQASWLVLSPVEAVYYARKHSNYQPMPPLREDCRMSALDNTQAMTLIYPNDKARIYIPKEREGQRGRLVIRVAHVKPEAEIFWNMDGQYLGSTQEKHQWAITAPQGLHHFSLVDKDGNVLEFELTFLQKDSN